MFLPCCLAKTRGIAIPVDLESQVSKMFSKTQIVMKHTMHWRSNAGKARRDSNMNGYNRDYKTIIDGLQVRVGGASSWLQLRRSRAVASLQ